MYGYTALKSAPLKRLWETSRMPDELIEELWQIKDGIAREHGYDVEAFVAHLRSRERMESWRVVDLRAAREVADYGAPGKRTDPGSR